MAIHMEKRCLKSARQTAVFARAIGSCLSGVRQSAAVVYV